MYSFVCLKYPVRKDFKKFCFIYGMPTNVHKFLCNLRNKPYRIELKKCISLAIRKFPSVHQKWIRESSHCNMHLQRRTYCGGPHFAKQHSRVPFSGCRHPHGISGITCTIIGLFVIDNELITSQSSMPDLFASKHTFAIP